ncbi:MAG: Gmad2 immunoglobulin-like domain-containing protein [Patescibacteria group bacterium]
MKSTHLLILVLVIVVLAIAVWFVQASLKTDVQTTDQPVSVLSFADCVAAGYPVMESNPRQCRTPDGRTYAEEPTPAQTASKITYMNANANNIVVESPTPDAVTGKEFSVIGKARGPWYFEASFPVEVLDANGKTIASGVAQAQGEWMTENFVPFKANLKVPDAYTGPATLVLHKDNPSGLPENDASVSFPFTIEF